MKISRSRVTLWWIAGYLGLTFVVGYAIYFLLTYFPLWDYLANATSDGNNPKPLYQNYYWNIFSFSIMLIYIASVFLGLIIALLYRQQKRIDWIPVLGIILFIGCNVSCCVLFYYYAFYVVP
jgi:hypothetical protein